MGQSLRQLESERSRVDWLKGAQSGLSSSPRRTRAQGGWRTGAVSISAAISIARWAPSIVADAGGVLSPPGAARALTEESVPASAWRGPVGQAALQTEITVVHAPAGFSFASSRRSPRDRHARPRAGPCCPHRNHRRCSNWPAEPGNERSTTCRSVRETWHSHSRWRGAVQSSPLLAKTQRQAEELTRAGTYKSQFLANMSHEAAHAAHAISASPAFHEERRSLNDRSAISRNSDQQPPSAAPDHDDHSRPGERSSRGADFRRVDRSDEAIGEVGAIFEGPPRRKAGPRRICGGPVHRRVVLDRPRLKQRALIISPIALKFSSVAIALLPEGPEFFRIEVDERAPDPTQDLQRLFVEFQQLDAGAAKRARTAHRAWVAASPAIRRGPPRRQRVGVSARPREAGRRFHAVLPRRAKGEVPAVARPNRKSTSVVHKRFGSSRQPHRRGADRADAHHAGYSCRRRPPRPGPSSSRGRFRRTPSEQVEGT